MRKVAVMLMISSLVAPMAAFAQEGGRPPTRDVREAETLTAPATDAVQAVPDRTWWLNVTAPAVLRNQSIGSPTRKDSVWNGVAMGAGAGAIIGTLFGLAIESDGGYAGYGEPVTFGVLGAGIGAGIGGGLDALLHRNASTDFSSQRNRSLGVAALLTRKVRGVTARVRF
jgi:hypothetical protein